MTELSRALDHGLQSANTFLETNSALLANTLALDKLSEFDGVEVRTRTGSCEALRAGRRVCALRGCARGHPQTASRRPRCLVRHGMPCSQAAGSRTRRLLWRALPPAGRARVARVARMFLCTACASPVALAAC
jgi:hypothetical protein